MKKRIAFVLVAGLMVVVSLLLNWDSADPSRLSVDPREWKMPLPVPSP